MLLLCPLPPLIRLFRVLAGATASIGMVMELGSFMLLKGTVESLPEGVNDRMFELFLSSCSD